MKLYDFFITRLYPVSKNTILYMNNFAMQNYVSSSTEIYIYNSLANLNIFNFFIFSHTFYIFLYISHIYLYISVIFLHFSMPIYITQSPTIQLSHMQWLLMVLKVSNVSTVSGYSTVSSFSTHPPMSFLHFTSFSQCSSQKKMRMHIYFIFIFNMSIFIFISNTLVLITPCIPFTIPQTTWNIYNSLECTGIFYDFWMH